ncbi:dolichyl-phosphate-mannose--protein mannosyltransferase [Umezakia ovalisporum]|jgi:dolichyl-phosphate-mannose--protein O-mannosyl transferase|uniref:dolichyl-phosphate-mannose--protein mannosyltransferase n=1 Tax=Umezakia ovalisporum TaxID=75695 RepID=UPI002475861D|nr:phospholipid carrier-dependent glycosyltransferase [Umezakia ovalisporum]MBI1241497.1 phospholipid carrier-dependent glycosyltransferase [Nostoc sp. RI_552]MDH6083637.1 phospholipid carrier-dependent glycosyltransferase [Umezakia ovalisporum TAC611]MDH6089019.1 phospholipid carrier-dependent glycosyltransferase [Umezakia ovalisporum Ak1311]
MSKKWFQIGITGVFLLSLALRFWEIDRFNTLVFDEVYFAKFGNNYLINKPFFNAHPPLSQYIIGIGIWIGSHLPFGQGTVNELTGSMRSPWSYRWINAFTGSFIPLVVAGIAYQLSHRHRFALLAGLFTACDGFFLVESRYALNNIYIVIFGLLGQLFLLLALNNQNQQRFWWLILAGISFGASVATKWNGLWFLLGIYWIWITAYIIRGVQSFPHIPIQLTSPGTVIRQTKIFLRQWYHQWLRINQKSSAIRLQTPIQNFTQINILHMVFYLGIIPAILYSIIWIPHLHLDRRYGFIEVHQKILQFHLKLGGNSSDVHPYCAAWYKWPLMNRPIAYYYQATESVKEPLSKKVIYDVHAMGNPFLWWFGVAAILFLAAMLLLKVVIPWLQQKHFVLPTNLTVETWIALYLVLNYAANLLPWTKVTRCVFMYHYMSAVVFGFLAIAWLVDQCFSSYYREIRVLGVTITFIIVGGFIFWMPLYLGLPLSSEGYNIRMWFNTWI